MYFNINKNIDIIKIGFKYYVFDINNRTFYEISKNTFHILKKCQKGYKLEKIIKSSLLTDKLFKHLEKNKIGSLSDTIEIQNKMNFNKNHLDMVWLNITEYCNFKCIHCYESASSLKQESKLDILDYKKFLELLTKKFSIQCIQITGGEPLSKGKDFIFKLISIIKNLEIPEIEIYSNLYLLDKEYIEFFKNNNVKIATSFYSQYLNTHDTITGVIGSHNKTLSSIKDLLKAKIKVRIGIIIMDKNKSESGTLRAWLNNKFNLSEKKQFDIVRPIGRGVSLTNIPIKLFEEKYILHKKLSYYDYDRYYFNKHYNSCWGNKICLKSSGILYPCVMSNLKLGNYKGINKILLRKNSYRYLTKDKIKVCKLCKYKYLCDECRAMYETYSKSIKEKPFVCSYNPLTDRWNKKIKIKDIINEN